jgi:vacuolar-type H+-ATPase catalytic subunit A/Vma1
LQRGRELAEIAALVGPESLQDGDRLALEASRTVREVLLGQSAYDPNDAWSSVKKTYRLALLAREFYRAGLAAIQSGAPFDLLDLGAGRRALVSVRNASEGEYETRAVEAAAVLSALARTGGST